MSKQENMDGEGDTPSVYVVSESIPGILCPVLSFMLWEGHLQTGMSSEENCKKSMSSEKYALYWDTKEAWFTQG